MVCPQGKIQKTGNNSLWDLQALNLKGCRKYMAHGKINYVEFCIFNPLSLTTVSMYHHSQANRMGNKKATIKLYASRHIMVPCNKIEKGMQIKCVFE